MGKSEELIGGLFCFEEFSLDASRRTLWRGDAVVDLRPKCFDVLTCLVREAGRVVTKDELIEAVWPKVVVTDESLTRCVSDIRQALGDAEQRIVKTVPRRGYVLVAPVSIGAPSPLSLAAPPEPMAEDVVVTRSGPAASIAPAAARPGTRSWKPLWLSLGALGVFVVVGATWVLATRTASPVTGGHVPAAGPLQVGTRPPLSIVVLPLVNNSSDPDQNYFAEGLTEDLTTDLSRIPDSFVIARGSANAYRGKVVDVRQIGRELGVRYIMEGSVQRMGDQVRLNLRLIDAEQGQELWADRLDGSRRELATLQSQVTGTVANALHRRMIDAESERSQRLRPINPDAQDLAWQALSAFERKTPDTNAAARGLAQRAVTLDPTSVLGWSVLGLTYTTDVGQRWLNLRGTTREEWLRRADEASAKAYALDPNDLFAVHLRADVLVHQGKPELSLAMRQRAVAINRNSGPAWGGLSYAYATLGQPEESIAAGLEALRLSPRDTRLFSFMVVIAAAHLYAGRDAEALIWAKRSVGARPDYSISHAWVAAAAANLGDLATARMEIAEFRRLQPDYSLATFKSERYSDKPEFLLQRERFYQGLHRAGLPD
jgi:adenylate cyclase